jgi:hypothetical protein
MRKVHSCCHVSCVMLMLMCALSLLTLLPLSLDLGLFTGIGIPMVFWSRLSWVWVRYWTLLHRDIPLTRTHGLRVFHGFTNVLSITQLVSHQCIKGHAQDSPAQIHQIPSQRVVHSSYWLTLSQKLACHHQCRTHQVHPLHALCIPGMLQSGTSRELFELWAPDSRTGLVVNLSVSFVIPGP